MVEVLSERYRVLQPNLLSSTSHLVSGISILRCQLFNTTEEDARTDDDTWSLVALFCCREKIPV